MACFCGKKLGKIFGPLVLDPPYPKPFLFGLTALPLGGLLVEQLEVQKRGRRTFPQKAMSYTHAFRYHACSMKK